MQVLVPVSYTHLDVYKRQPFNSIAIDMANKKYNSTPPLELEDIDSWENTGRASVIKEFDRDNTLYELSLIHI